MALKTSKLTSLEWGIVLTGIIVEFGMLGYLGYKLLIYPIIGE